MAKKDNGYSHSSRINDLEKGLSKIKESILYLLYFTVSVIIIFTILFTIVFSKIRSERDYVNNRIVELQNNIEAISIDIPIVGERRAITYSYNGTVFSQYAERICAQSAIKYILDYLGLEFKATRGESKVFLEKVKKDK